MDPVKTGTLIRTLRTRLGLTQRELAERLTVSDRTISKWERDWAVRTSPCWRRWHRPWGSAPRACSQRISLKIPRKEEI